MVLFNYNFTVPSMSMHGATRNLQFIFVTCLCGPCIVVAWNIHGSCNLSCAKRGIVRHGIATCLTVTQATCYGKYLTMPYCKDAMK